MPFTDGLQSRIHHRSSKLCRNGTMGLWRFANRPERLILATANEMTESRFRAAGLPQDAAWVSREKTKKKEISSDMTARVSLVRARSNGCPEPAEVRAGKSARFPHAAIKSMIHNFSHGGLVCIDLSRLGSRSTNKTVLVGLAVDVGLYPLILTYMHVHVVGIAQMSRTCIKQSMERSIFSISNFGLTVLGRRTMSATNLDTVSRQMYNMSM